MRNFPKMPVLQDNRAYNYIFLFSSGNIKIGMSTNVTQRFKQLSNSNSGGFEIVNYYISPPNYIAKTLEKYLHHVFRNNRIEGEFFSDLNFDEVCTVCDAFINSSQFQAANERKKNLLNKGEI